VAVWCLAARWI